MVVDKDKTPQSGEFARAINQLETMIKALQTQLANTQSVYVASTNGGSPTTKITVVKV